MQKKQDNLDDTFIILIDGVEVPYKEITTNSESRTISIDFEEGDSDIEIIGTFVVPEFSSIALIILVAGIISMILLSSKFKIPLLKILLIQILFKNHIFLLEEKNLEAPLLLFLRISTVFSISRFCI